MAAGRRLTIAVVVGYMMLNQASIIVYCVASPEDGFDLHCDLSRRALKWYEMLSVALCVRDFLSGALRVVPPRPSQDGTITPLLIPS